MEINNQNLKAVLEKKMREICKIKENIDSVKFENQNMMRIFDETDKNVSFFCFLREFFYDTFYEYFELFTIILTTLSFNLNKG